tara:strand:+ start:565 stop:750 length:186 start_codon:yes stop_codon:yes gene_type:complete
MRIQLKSIPIVEAAVVIKREVKPSIKPLEKPKAKLTPMQEFAINGSNLHLGEIEGNNQSHY